VPWSCPSCAHQVELDESTCPACGAAKSAWTIIKDRTRTMVVPGRKRFVLRRGESRRSAPAGEATLVLVEAEEAIVLDEEQARRIAERGHVPAPADLLFVGLYPGKRSDLSVTVEALYETQAGEPLEVPRERAEGEPDPVLVAFVFLDTAEVPADLEFPDVQIVAIGEENEAGFAPSVEFSALGKDAQEVPAVRKPLPKFAFST